jgi:hypothetical protein
MSSETGMHTMVPGNIRRNPSVARGRTCLHAIRFAGMGRCFATYPDRSVRPEKTSASRGADRHAAYNPLTSG